MPLNVSLPQVLDEHHEGRMQDVHTAVPGQIVSWTTTGLATVQPTVRKPLTSTDDFTVFETLPEIKNVPCFALAAGGYLVSMPYAAGDPVFLIFSEQSYAEYMATGQISNPKDIRRHGVGYPYAIPGPRPTTQGLSSVSATALVIGKDGGAEQFVIDSGRLDAGASGVQSLVTHNDYENFRSALAIFLQPGNFSSTVTIAAAAATFLSALSAGAQPVYTTLFKAK